MTKIQFTTSLIGFLGINIICMAQKINPGIVLTFDDNAVSNWHRLIPIFETHNAHATFFVTQPYIFNETQLQQINELHEAGNEIGCHSYNHYNAVNFIDSSSIDNYIKQEITPSIEFFDSAMRIKINSFAYPYGARDDAIDKYLLKYFKCIRGTNYALNSSQNKIGKLSHPGLVYGVGIDDDYENSLQAIKNELTRCKNDSLIIIFYSHKPVDEINGPYEISYAKLDSILQYANDLDLPFYLMNEVRLPVPTTPVGDTLISTAITQSVFTTVSSTLQYNWKITPPEAASVYPVDDSMLTVWNSAYSGEVTISVAYQNRCGIGNYSAPLKIQVKPITDIRKEFNSVKLYPNPTNGIINVEISNFENAKYIEIYNASGQKLTVMHVNGLINSFYLTTKGLHVVRIIFDNYIITRLIVVK